MLGTCCLPRWYICMEFESGDDVSFFPCRVTTKRFVPLMPGLSLQVGQTFLRICSSRLVETAGQMPDLQLHAGCIPRTSSQRQRTLLRPVQALCSAGAHRAVRAEEPEGLLCNPSRKRCLYAWIQAMIDRLLLVFQRRNFNLGAEKDRACHAAKTLHHLP
jgi:hypothetical protein